MDLALYGSGAELLGIKHNMYLICVCLKALGVLKDTLMRTCITHCLCICRINVCPPGELCTRGRGQAGALLCVSSVQHS